MSLHRTHLKADILLLSQTSIEVQANQSSCEATADGGMANEAFIDQSCIRTSVTRSAVRRSLDADYLLLGLQPHFYCAT